MARLVFYQLLILVAISIVFTVMGGWVAGFSALLGGMCYLVPTVAAVLVLNFFQAAGIWQPASFFWGESLKIILSIIMMALTAIVYPALQWLPFLLGLVMVSHIVFFVYWKIKASWQVKK